MKQLLDALKSARKIELLVLAAALCILLVLWIGQENTAASSEEERMQRILSRIDGAGRVSVMLAQNDAGETTGAVVAASGAEDLRVLLELQRAVQTLTGLELNQIEVVKSGR